MDTKTGNVYIYEPQRGYVDNRTPTAKAREPFSAVLKRLQIMALAPTDKQMSRKPNRVAGHEPCPCGSGKRFRACCRTAI